MNQARSYDIETENARFDLIIHQDKKTGVFIGEYFGTSPKFAQVVLPGQEPPEMKCIGEGSVVGRNVQEVEQQCRVEIERIDGSIFMS